LLNITIINRQKRYKVNQLPIRKLAKFLLEKSGKRGGIIWGDVSVVLVEDQESRDVNRAHLGHDYATDVISFNFDPMPGDTENEWHGEIVINVDFVCRTGPTYKGPNHELALYLAHGCDHLSGADDNTSQRRQQMRHRELRWLRGAKQQGLNLTLLTA